MSSMVVKVCLRVAQKGCDLYKSSLYATKYDMHDFLQ